MHLLCRITLVSFDSEHSSRVMYISHVVFPTGMFAIRADHDFVVQEDFMKAVRKVADSKKLESKLDYKPV